MLSGMFKAEHMIYIHSSCIDLVKIRINTEGKSLIMKLGPV